MIVGSGGAGDSALLLGTVALLFVFVPVIGDFVTVPAGLLAVGLGLRKFLRAEAGGVGESWRSLIGAVAGLVALFFAFMTFAAMGMPGSV